MSATVAALALSSVVSAEDGARAGTGLRSQVVAGQRVKLEGRSTRDGRFEAERVTLRDADRFVKVEGAIASVSQDRKRIEMLGYGVIVTGRTRIYNGTQLSTSRAMLVPGAWVEAKGLWRAGVIEADRIRVKVSPGASEELEGALESVGAEASSLAVLGRRVVLPPDAAIVDERTSGQPSSSAARLRRDDDDGESRRGLEFGRVVVGGRVEAGFLEERNFEPQPEAAERTMLSRVQVLASSRFTDTIEGYAKLTMNRNLAPGDAGRGEVNVSEAYVLAHRLGGWPLNVQVGRQRFRDAREWMFDDYLDAARVQVPLSSWTFDAAVTRGIAPGPQRSRSNELQFSASAAATLAPGLQLSAYALARRDTTRGERPVWVGALLNARPDPAWTFWGAAAVRRGHGRTSRLGGFAIDAGVTHRWAAKWTPSITAGYAVASGDGRSGDGVDARFRQTDLEDNRAYFGGLRRVAIYGELFDPELSNLRVLTAALGVRPRRGLALEAIYHHYSQAVASTSLPSSSLEARLTGTTRALGQELDGVLTFRATSGVDIDLAAGVFLPGSAFGERTTPSVFWRPQLRFYF